jgi:SAM-dependent methyltransferase
MPEPMSQRGHLEAVRSDYNNRGPQWDNLYAGEPPSFHDHVLQERLHIAGEAVVKYGPDHGRAIDLGCGAGQMVEWLGAHGYEAHGVDISDTLVRKSVARLDTAGQPVRITQGDGGKLPLRGSAFDVITALGFVEYLPSVEVALGEISRIARPGALVVVSVPNPVRLTYLLDPLGVLRGRFKPDHAGYRRHYLTAGKISRLIAAAGLDLLEVHGHGVANFTLAGKPMLRPAKAIALDGRTRALSPALRARIGADLITVSRKA